ncbi:hypothetical protein ASF92_10075 [Pedobacter sp. Leaf176]|nr:hypothetical protein ASF92_10075 [Pedobacter sp. Leaf176]
MKKQNRGAAELIKTNENNKKPLINCRLKIYSLFELIFNGIHEGYAVFYLSYWFGFVKLYRNLLGRI